MPDTQTLLTRLLNTPDLAKIVPHLPADVLHRVIQRCGLEDCADLVALATPQQLTHMLDDDVWRVRASGVDEGFDVDRFGLWIEVLMQAGAATAAEKLIGLDIELTIAGFSRLAAVFDAAAASAYTTLDGEELGGRAPHDGTVAEIGGYLIESRRPAAWDAVVELLAFLGAGHPAFFHRLMRGCVRLSNGQPEADGFHDLLNDRDQDMFDVASDRAARREAQGYVMPAEARAFLQEARTLRLDADRPAPSPLAQAYFREMEARSADPDALEGSHDAVDARGGDLDAGAMASVIEVLRDGGVLTPPPRGLLQAPDGQASRLGLIEAHAEAHEESARELAYLTNAVIAGCTIQDRPFTPVEASDAAIAACNLGLENWPAGWQGRDLITAFQVGWSTLYRDVCAYAARRLIEAAAGIRGHDGETLLQLRTLARELTRHLRHGAPWDARPAFEVLMILDAPSWAAMLALIDQCPVMHAAVRPHRARHAIGVGDFEFIAGNSQIAAVRAFLEALPSALAP